jgi:nitroreductase
MDTYRVIVGKRDTRAFSDQAVPAESQRRILQAGRMAGSSKNSQPCRFIAIEDAGGRAEIAKCGDFSGWVPTTPWLVAVAVPGEAPRGEFDAGRAAQNMMVAAWSEGIGSCPATMHHPDCAREALGLPADYRVVIVIGFGFPSRPQKHVAEAARKPWDEYVHRERWGGAG